jgi:ferredoxin-NADP reductase/predicted pyridoxine 5'-phosphate oxidase superfamily flavin-nucleotide-binding protein
MGRAYSDITFTPTVRDVQTELGSREQYAFLDTHSDRGDTLTPREAAFIAEADHFFQATVSETGWPYVQHRGGPKGFLKVLDPRTLGFADYRGNVQYLSVGNLRRDDRISLIVMDYLNRRRLKLLGRVTLVNAEDDPVLLAAVRDDAYGATIERAFVIRLEGWDWNCPQHITTRVTEDEVGTIVAPLRAQVQRMRTQLAAAKAAAPQAPTDLGDGPLALRVAGVRQLTDTVRAYELVAADGAPLPAVSAGAHLDVPMRLDDGSTTTRSYSIASSPLRTDAYEIAVLREPKGSGGSAAVHQDFAIGLRLYCAPPANAFALDTGPHRAVLVAGGIGITPIKAMAHALAAAGREFELHFACRSRAQAPFLGQLIEQFGARVRVFAADEGQRLDVPALLRSIGASAHVYVCGPSGLIDAVRTGADEAGIDPGRIHFERFVAPRDETDTLGFTVRLVRSEVDVQVPPGRSILEALEARGFRPPASCRIGTCGTCAMRVVAGEPLHRDAVLTPEQRQVQHLMCICVSRAEGTGLRLDY